MPSLLSLTKTNQTKLSLSILFEVKVLIMSTNLQPQKVGTITLIGRPNSGKSTLLNAILGTELSIVTPKAQTTRDRILGILTEKEGQILFTDTPGIHRAKEGGLNSYMVNEATEALEAPDLVWYLVDPSSSLKHEAPVMDLLKTVRAPVFLLMNKIDSFGKNVRENRVAPFEEVLAQALEERGVDVKLRKRISALKKKEIPELLKESWKYLPEGHPLYPDSEILSDRPTRFFVAEKIREKLYLFLGEEVPYSCAIEIEKFDENSIPIRIEAIIYVERDSQKGIVIGKGAKKIKEIGQSARQDIEKFLGQKIFLGLRVKVLKDWSKDAEALRRIGYHLPEKRKA